MTDHTAALRQAMTAAVYLLLIHVLITRLGQEQ